MTPSLRPAKQMLLFASVLFAITTVAQAPPKYDPSTETTVKGTVEELKLVPPSGGKPVLYLVVKAGSQNVEVMLGPKSFLDDMGAAYKPSDAVEITGSKVKQDSGELVLARQVTKGDDVLTLRFKDGKPAW